MVAKLSVGAVEVRRGMLEIGGGAEITFGGIFGWDVVEVIAFQAGLRADVGCIGHVRRTGDDGHVAGVAEQQGGHLDDRRRARCHP
jgi:hypothetical protein